MNVDDASLRNKRIDVLMMEIISIRRKVGMRYRFNNAVLPVSLAGFAATLGLSEKFSLKWLILFLPPGALILASYSILQLAYTFWLDSYLKSKATQLNELLGMELVDYELTHAQSKNFREYRSIPIGIIWVTWFCFYACCLAYIYTQGGLGPDKESYLALNLLLFLIHIVACYRIGYRLPNVAKSEFHL